MPEIKLKARIQNKYETLEEWNKLVEGEFIPLKGEVCYGIDQEKLYQKIGDGETDFVNLPWILNQSDWSEYDYTSPQFICNRPGGYWQTIDTTEKSTIFTLNYTDNEIDLSSDLGVFGEVNLTELDERLFNFPAPFDLIVKNNSYEVAKFADIEINKPLPFILEPRLEIYYQGNVYNIIKEFTGLTSKEEINSLGIYDTGELYGFVLVVRKGEHYDYANITFWLSPDFKTATSLEFNSYSYDFVPLPINYTNLDANEFVGKFDETGSNTKFGEIFNDYVRNQAIGDYSHAEGNDTKSIGPGSHAEGRNTIAGNDYSHAEGSSAQALGFASHSEGQSYSKGQYAHAEGSTGLGNYTFKGECIETNNTIGLSKIKVTVDDGRGINETYIGKYVIAERDTLHPQYINRANREIYKISQIENLNDGDYVYLTKMKDYGSSNYGFEQGVYNFYFIETDVGGAFGDYSHAEGKGSVALGRSSHAEGFNSIAYGDYQHVQGKSNIVDYENKYAMIIGNGEYSSFGSKETNSNAMTVDWNGQVVANNYAIPIIDEKGENNLLNIVTHGDMDIEFEKFEIISHPGEKTIGDIFVLYEEKIKNMQVGAEYQCQSIIFDSDDNNKVIQTTESTIRAQTLTELSGTLGYEDIIVLYDEEELKPLFINGVKFKNNVLEKSDDTSLVISGTLLTNSEYSVRLIIDGPGMARNAKRYKKLPQKYLELEEKTEEPDVITQVIKPEFDYPYYALYDYKGDSLDSRISSRYYIIDLGDEKREQGFIMGSIGNSIEAYQPFYYVTEIDIENKRFSLKTSLESTNSIHYRIDYSLEDNYTPTVGDVLAFTEPITKDGTKLVPFRKIKSANEFIMSYNIIDKPIGYNKCKITTIAPWCENITTGVCTNKIRPQAGIGWLTTKESLLSNYADLFDETYTNTKEVSYYNEEPSDNLIIGDESYLRQKAYVTWECNFSDYCISTFSNIIGFAEGEQNEGWQDNTEVIDTAGSQAIQKYEYITIDPNNKIYDKFLALEGQIKIWIAYMKLQGNEITIEWRK